MGIVTIYAPTATDFSSNGLGILQPISCAVEEERNGMYELTIVHPIRPDLRWAQIQNGCIIKADVPMRESPLYESEAYETAGATTVTRRIYKVDTNGGRLHLRKKPSTSAKILGRYKEGTEVIRLKDNGDGWYQVSIRKGGATGYMYAQYLDYVKDITETVSTGKTVSREGVSVQPAREQLFRVYSVETDTARRRVTAKAMHIFYDLRGNPLKKAYAPSKAAANTAVNNINNNLLMESEFDVYPYLAGKVTGDYGYQSMPEALLTPDEGILAQTGGLLVRDNFDIFLLPDDIRDMGVTVRRGKNLKSVTVETDSTDVITRIIPVGTDEDGKDLLLDGTIYVDSTRINDYPTILARRIDYDVRVSDADDSEFKTNAEARAELKRLAQQDFASGIDLPTYGMKVDFIMLGNTAEYAGYAALQSVHLHDTVTVIDELIGLTAKVRVTGYKWNVLTGQYDSITLGELHGLKQTTYGYDIAPGSVSGNRLIPGSVSGGALIPGSVDGSVALRDLSVQYAKFEIATVKQLNAEAVNAIAGRFGEIAAGSITTDELYASLAEIVTLMVKSINAENIETDELYAALADVILLRAQQINAGNIETDALAAKYAEIAALLVENLTAANIQADRLGAALAEFVTMYAGVGKFDFATIQNFLAEAFILQQGHADTMQIINLAVTSANLLSATLGKLVLKGDDGRYYRVFVGSDGSVSTEEVSVTDEEINAGQTGGGQQIVETSMNVGSLNASNLQASSAVINRILTTALTAEKITAADALIASATIPQLYATSIKALGAGLDLSGNEYIKLVVGEIDSKVAAKSNVFRGETAPDGANLNDLWIVPGTGYTYQLVADDSVHPNYYLDESGYLYYEYASGQTVYPLQMDASGDLYISEDADFIAAITQDGTPALWERVKDSELADAAQAANDAAEAARAAAQAAQAKANQNAEDMAEVVTQFESELSSLQSQVDGHIATWFEYGVPTASGYPASQWTTTELKNAHLGDLYYDRNTGYCYRWQLSGAVYSWTRIADTDVTKALSDAAAAKDVADSKRRVFVSTPTPPYDIGDLWVQGSGGDIMRCQYARSSGSYYASDWVKASKYTDDTKANENAQIIAQHTAELQLMDDRIAAKVEQSISEVSGELETQISSSFSEVTQTVDELRVEMGQNRAADKEEIRTYLRYADGRVELGRSDSRYVSQTSDNGFVVLQDGSPMASIVQNTISAPVIEANRMFAIGDFVLRLGANGHLILA